VEILDVKMRDESETETATFATGKPMYVDVCYRAHRRVEKPVFGFSVKTGNGFYVFGANTQVANFATDTIEGDGVMRIKLDPLMLMRGNFFLSLSIHSWDHAVQFHRREDWYPFAVRNTGDALGVFHLPCSWEQRPV
jgi:ABC-2 type transport system ATP-binding protein/lipopolysaccharide transport system ATP-binding protein